MLDWLIVVVASCLTVSGLDQVDRMSSKTNHLIRLATVSKTAGSALTVIVFMAHIFGRDALADDCVYPVLLLLFGMLCHKLVDRRRRDQCALGECNHRSPE